MVASVASFGSLNLAQGLTARAVSPAPVAPVLRDQARRPAALGSASPASASTVAFAPAAMTALIEAQERLAQDASTVVRQDTAQKIDQLIARLNDGSGPVATHADVPFAVRQLIVARQALSESLIDLQA
jgi:hypothetical protein